MDALSETTAEEYWDPPVHPIDKHLETHPEDEAAIDAFRAYQEKTCLS